MLHQLHILLLAKLQQGLVRLLGLNVSITVHPGDGAVEAVNLLVDGPCLGVDADGAVENLLDVGPRAGGSDAAGLVELADVHDGLALELHVTWHVRVVHIVAQHAVHVQGQLLYVGQLIHNAGNDLEIGDKWKVF